MFDFFVTETIWIYEITVAYDWIFAIFYFMTTLAAWSIFIHHELQFKDLKFFMENVDGLYLFSNSRYKLNRVIFSTLLPLAMLIILWSIIERFNSKKFLMRFG